METKINNKIYIILSIFITASLILVVFFVWPLSKEIEKNSQDLISAKNDIVTLGEQTNETKNFKDNYETYKPNFEKIDQLFVDPDNLVDFIEFLEDTASSCQITAQASVPSASSNSQKFTVLQFSSRGSFAGILTFVEKIEKGPYLIEIENLTIQRSLDNDSKTFTAAFTIKAFINK